MSETDQLAEIKRLLAFSAASHANPFSVLQLDLDTCTFADVSKQYRKIALLLHPDKCSLAHATDAFQVAEKSYKSINNEIVFQRLKDAHKKKKEQGTHTSAAGPSGRAAAAAAPPRAGGATDLPPIPFGTLSQLATSGISTDEQKKAEIQRVLRCKPSDYFYILDVDPETADVAAVARRYRRMAQALHPDKCDLPHVTDAFTVFERAHKELSDEKKLIRLKVGFLQQRQREAAVAAETARRATTAHPTSTYASLDAHGRREMRKRENLHEMQLEAARLAEEAERKRRKVEKETAEATELSAELERQRREWKDMKLF